MYQDRKKELMDKLKNLQLMDNYYSNKEKQQNPIGSVIGLGKNLYSGFKQMNTPQQASPEFMNKIGASKFEPMKFSNPTNGIEGLGNTSLNTQAMPTNSLSGVGNGAGQAAQGAGQGMAQQAGSAIGKAAPVVGAAMGGFSAANNFKNGNYTDGALDLAKTGAMFIPGVGWAISGAIQIGQMIKNMFDKKSQEAMKKSQEEAAKSTQASMESAEQNKQGFDEVKQENMQKMQEQRQKMQQTPQNNDALVADILNQYKQGQPQQEEEGTYKESLPFGKQMNELDSYLPFDTSQLGQTTSGAILGLLDDKLGTNLEGTIGNTTPGAQVLDASPINRRDSKGNIVSNKLEGQPTGAAANITMPTNYKEESMPTMDEKELPYEGSAQQALDEQAALKRSMMDKFRSGISDFSAGYKDNANTDFAHGDLMKGVTTGGASPVQTSDSSFDLGAEATKKGIMARLGEMAGTGQRIMAHPLTQAAIAGGISKLAGGDLDDIAKAAYQYGTAKANADRYYQQVTGKTNRPFLNTYSAQDVTNKRLEDALAQRQQQWQEEQKFKKDKDQRDYDYKVNKDKEDRQIKREELQARKEYYKTRGSNASLARLDYQRQKDDLERQLKLAKQDYDNESKMIKASDDFGMRNEQYKGLFGNQKTRQVPITREEAMQEALNKYNQKVQAILSGQQSPVYVEDEGWDF